MQRTHFSHSKTGMGAFESERPAQGRRAKIVEMEQLRDTSVAWRGLLGILERFIGVQY